MRFRIGSQRAFTAVIGGLRAFAPVLAGTLMLLGAVLADGRPTVFPDTDDYFSNGRGMAFEAAYRLHLMARPAPPTDPDEIADARQRAEDAHKDRAQLKARSPWYGLFLYLTQRIGTLWLTTAIQAFVAAWGVWRLWRLCAPGAPAWSAYAAQAATALLSTAGIFAGFAMPDIFAGSAALAAIALMMDWSILKRGERAAICGVICFAAIIHGTHSLIVVSVLIPALLAVWLLKGPWRPALIAAGAIGGALVAAMLINTLTFAAVRMATGDTPGRPPFLAMRVIADGPGRTYLRRVCEHGARWTLCRFRNLPLDNSDHMMWSDKKSDGVFNVSDYDTRVALEHEEMRFVLAVIASDPIGVVQAGIANWGRQLVGVYLDDPILDPHYYLANPYWRSTNLPWLIDQGHGCGADHHGCRPRLSSTQSWWFHSTICILSVLAMLARLAMPDVRRTLRARAFHLEDRTSRALVAGALVLIAFVANALICGALSGPFPRYGARMAWLTTAGAACLWASALPLAQQRPWTPARWLSLLAARPEWRWAAARWDPAMLRFAMVGGAGFVIDRLLLSVGIALLGLNSFTGRLFSFSLAVAATWALNRAFTFRQAVHAHPPFKQAMLYAAVQGAGFALNYGAYAVALLAAPALKAHLLVPLAIGSAAGLTVTWVGSRRLAFQPAPESAV